VDIACTGNVVNDDGNTIASTKYIGVSLTAGGWAFNPDQPLTPVALELLGDGKILATFLANHYRDDLRQAGLGRGAAGFTLACDPSWTTQPFPSAVRPTARPWFFPKLTSRRPSRLPGPCRRKTLLQSVTVLIFIQNL
jgi:hypothetical protein